MFPDDLTINKNEGQCVLDMIVVAAHKAWPLFSRQKLVEELDQLALPGEKDFLTEGVCPRHISAWAASRKRVTCIGLNPFGRPMEKVVAQGRTDFSLVFIFNNNHVYPITDPEMMQNISKTGRADFSVMQYSAGDEKHTHVLLEEAMQNAENEATASFRADYKIVHVETDDLSPVLKAVVTTTGYNPTGVMTNGPRHCF